MWKNYLGTMEWLFSRFRRLFSKTLTAIRDRLRYDRCALLLQLCCGFDIGFSWLVHVTMKFGWIFFWIFVTGTSFLQFLICFLVTFENSCGISWVYFTFLLLVFSCKVIAAAAILFSMILVCFSFHFLTMVSVVDVNCWVLGLGRLLVLYADLMYARKEEQ